MPKKKSSGTTNQSSHAQSKPEQLSGVPIPDLRAIEGLMRQILPGSQRSGSRIDAAQEVMYEAFEEANPRRQQVMARKALEISPDCADAYVLLAEHAQNPADELELYEQGVAAGERAIGRKGLKELAGHFWGIVETRPYMRAREGLANSLWEAGRCEEAVEHCVEMLRFNPNDNQGIRYRLLAMLFDLERHDEIEQLITQYNDDSSAEWAYTRALLEFRREGDTARAREALSAAEKINAHVPIYLTQAKQMPRETPDYITLGGEDEAIGYVAQFLPAWKETPGATTWLRKTLKLTPIAGPTRKRQLWSKLCPALRRLPQDEHETWEFDLREIAAPQGGEADSHWMVVAFNSTLGEVVHFDFFDARPKDAEVLSFVTAALLEPQEGEPHRPSAICVSRKGWFRCCKTKLAEIGVECQLAESLEAIDRWVQSATPQLTGAQAAATPPAEWSALATLPHDSEAIWQALVDELPMWVPEDGEPKRPWVCIITDIHSEAILATAIETKESPDDLLLKVVWQALKSPAVGEAQCPGMIHVASDGQAEILAQRLEPLGVQCVMNTDLQLARQLVRELTAHLGGPRQRQAMIHAPGVTLAQVGELFAAASEFYRARPWRQVPGKQVIRVACDRFQSGPWYAVVMGQSGIEQGLALYEDAELLSMMLRDELSDKEMSRRTSALSVTFGEKYQVEPEDLDAALAHGWKAVGPEAYPCVLRVNPGMVLRTPLKWELELLEGCLRAIPDYLSRNVGKAEVPIKSSSYSCTFQLEQMEGG